MNCNIIEEPAKYKKKKKSHISKSEKRSDHKHEYKTILLDSFMGFVWTDRCKVCGRLKSKSYAASQDGLIRPTNMPGISIRDFYTAEELHEKYPDVDIYHRLRGEDGMLQWGDQDIERIY